MEVLLLRAGLTPLLVLTGSIVARKLGPRLGGRLLGLPLTTAPFLVLICAELGPQAAQRAAHGAALGQLTVVTFCVAYACLAGRMRPSRTVGLAIAVAAVAEILVVVMHNLWVSAGIVLAAGLFTRPGRTESPQPRRRSRWDTPIRMTVSGVIVLVLTTTAPALGPPVAGALSALPVLLAVMAPSVHRASGAQAANDLMHGALTSAVGTTGFLIVVSYTVVPLGAVAAFAWGLGAMAAGDAAVRTAHRLPRIKLP